MGIKILPDSIKIGSFTLSENADGLVFDGSTRVEKIAYPITGSVAGYSSGGRDPTHTNTIDKFPFATNANASDVGDLTQTRTEVTGQSSDVSGYTSGGEFTPGTQMSNVIDRFSFSFNLNATDVGDLTQARSRGSGQFSTVNGYMSGGYDSSGPALSFNTINKFSFAINLNATDVGDMSTLSSATGHSSDTYGYSTGGETTGGYTPTPSSRIERFPFAVDSNDTYVSDLTLTKVGAAGQSSEVNAYSSGGFISSQSSNVIEKFPFFNEATVLNIADLSVARHRTVGQSSNVYGYTSGGVIVNPVDPPTATNTVDRFPFATNANATDVGDLTQARWSLAGQQD